MKPDKTKFEYVECKECKGSGTCSRCKAERPAYDGCIHCLSTGDCPTCQGDGSHLQPVGKGSIEWAVYDDVTDGISVRAIVGDANGNDPRDLGIGIYIGGPGNLCLGYREAGLLLGHLDAALTVVRQALKKYPTVERDRYDKVKRRSK